MSAVESEPLSQPSIKRRAWFRQFSIRSLLLLMLVTAVAVGWLGNEVRVARDQNAVVQRFREDGISVSLESRNRKLVPESELTRRIFGESFFFAAFRIHATKYVSADLLSSIERLPPLVDVFLNNTQANDETVRVIAASDRLEQLFLGATEITDRGLEHFVDHPALFSLVVFDTKVTNLGMDSICDVPKLKSLAIQQTSITDAAVRALVESKLRDQLVELDVSETAVTSDSLPDLAKLSQLTHLRFREISTTVEQLKLLAELPRLRRIDITGSGLSSKEVEKLQASLADTCYVHCADAK